MTPNEDPVHGIDADIMARGATLATTTGPASEQCQYGDHGRALSNDGEEKLFRPDERAG